MPITLGIDLGDVRTGIAVSDAGGKMAFGVCTITEYNEEKLLDRICALIAERKADKVVLGLPVNMDGSKGFRADKIKAFGEKLEERCGKSVEYCDERCSTMLAHTYLNMTDTRGKKRKAVVDRLSAEIILQSYLDAQASKIAREGTNS